MTRDGKLAWARAVVEGTRVAYGAEEAEGRRWALFSYGYFLLALSRTDAGASTTPHASALHASAPIWASALPPLNSPLAHSVVTVQR